MPKCADCGLVGVYDGNDQIHEVASHARTHGGIPKGYKFIICTAKAFPIHKEVDALNSTSVCYEGRILKVLNTERDCPSFFDWQPNCNPKEHGEQKRMIELEKMRVEQRDRDLRFQEERRTADREARLKEADIERQWKEKQADRNEAFQLKLKKDETRRQIIIASFGAVLTVIGTIFLVWLGFKKP